MDELQKEIATYQKERHWDKIEPADLAKSVMIEGAELLELFQWNNHSVEAINADPELKENLQKELADVLIYAIQLALRLDINIEEAIKRKLDHNRAKYPVAQIVNDTPGNDFYNAQKKKYRSLGK